MTLTDFGLDRHAVEGMRWRHVTGLQNLGIALFRRLITPRGGLFYDPNYGTDIRDYLNRSFTNESDALFWEIEQVVIAEVLKDPRVYDAVASFVPGPLETRTARLTILLTTALGPFRLVINADNVTSEGVRLEIAN